MNKRGRNNSVYHHSHMHCPEDLACRLCCPCVSKLQLQINILQEKNVSLAKNNKEKQQMLLKLSKEIKRWQLRGEQFDKLDDFKEKIRKTIKKQVQQENKVQNFIVKQKFDSMKKQKKQLEQQKSTLQEQYEKLKKFLQKNENKMSTLQKTIDDMNKQKGNSQKVHEQLSNKLAQEKAKFTNIQGIIKDKTNIITRLQNVISQSDQYFALQKSKSSNIQYQAQQIQQNLSKKELQLNSLQKIAQEKSNSIQNLTVEKEKLNKLVVELDSTIHSYSELSNQLRGRIMVSQDYALMKEIQAKKLQIDLYDSLYQRFPLI